MELAWINVSATQWKAQCGVGFFFVDQDGGAGQWRVTYQCGNVNALIVTGRTSEIDAMHDAKGFATLITTQHMARVPARMVECGAFVCIDNIEGRVIEKRSNGVVISLRGKRDPIFVFNKTEIAVKNRTHHINGAKTPLNECERGDKVWVRAEVVKVVPPTEDNSGEATLRPTTGIATLFTLSGGTYVIAE